MRVLGSSTLLALSPAAPGAVTLGSATNFAVLASSTVTNTGPSQISGEVGVSTGTSITGFPPGLIYGGTFHSNDSLAILARASAQSTYNSLVLMSTTLDLTGQDLGGMTLGPGVYHFDSIAQLTGILTLDGLGAVDPVWVFQVGSSFTAASAAAVLAINGADPLTNVFFQVGSSATIGTGASFAGSIIASDSVTLTTGASLTGRAIALNGAVTLDNNHVVVPEPATGALLLAGFAFALSRRRRKG